MEPFQRGVRIFKSRIFEKRRKFFERLASGQSPQALFITCADSRVVPALITQSNPGDLFVERNPGNIVPVYSDQWVGVSASIEYAVSVLKVPAIIVCGHTDCGAIKAILHPERVTSIPAVGRWLQFGAAAVSRVDEALPSAPEPERLRALTFQNVLLQKEHLLTHPSVRQSCESGKLTIHGWVYELHTGDVLAYDPESRQFHAL